MKITSANEVRNELRKRGYRSDVLYAKDNHENLKVDMVRVWANPADRYPAQCMLSPYDIADCWNWGNRFQHRGNAIATAEELADAVIETLEDK